jgi:uncharacterized protein DUF3147
MTEILIRFIIGGVSVSFFSLLGDIFKPKSFAGLFGAAPSVALATLALTISKEGTHYAAIEAKSMMLAAVAFLIYASCVSWTMMRHKHSALFVASAFLGVWAAAAFGLWYIILK